MLLIFSFLRCFFFQVCSNGTRVFVHRKIKDAFVSKLVPRVASLRVGHPMKEDTQVGALISPDHAAKVLKYIESAKDEVKTTRERNALREKFFTCKGRSPFMRRRSSETS